MLLSKISTLSALKQVKIPTSSSNSCLVLVCLKQQQTRNFSQELIGKRYEKPWDYKKHQYGLLGQFYDSTMRRLGDNSLIITVEGNFGSGKSEFAQELAKKIDFVYARQPDFEEHLYKLPNGQSARSIINEIVEGNERFHLDSIEDWHLNPTFKKTINVQNNFYTIRWMQMRTALLHLMSTGKLTTFLQGIL